jgi:hypothetical protein
VLSIGIGIGLAAAAGFRVFVPLFVLSLAARAGYLPLSPGFDWIGSTQALLAFGAATTFEIGAYYIPWLDNVLDTVAGPAAVIAGVIASASVITDLPPLLKWSVAIIAGGTAAGLVQASTSVLRLESTVTTGGLANPLVATTELAGSVVTSVLAIIVPAVAIVLVLVVLYVAYRVSRRLLRRRTAPSSA